jgi:sugar-phosphatase
VTSAVVFDLDGVLVDSQHAVERTWRRWAEQQGVAPDAVLAFVHGRRAREVVTRFAPQLDIDGESRRLLRLEVAESVDLPALPGAADCVRIARCGPWAVVTSGGRELATARLDAVGLPVPDVLIAAEDVVHGKPDPEPFERASLALGLGGDVCVAIEDAPAGITAAKRAGMHVVGVTTTHPASALRDADRVVGSLHDVAAHLSRLLGTSTGSSDKGVLR